MNILIVYAHPEPNSFNGALKELAERVLTEQSHEVRVSDLYRMRFKAQADRHDFLEQADPDYLQYQVEQRHAFFSGTFPRDIQEEIDKLRWADTVIFQFPLLWFSLPAILKGWVDRVMTWGFAYGMGQVYETGGLRGKRALLSMTTGAPARASDPNGRNGDIEVILWPIHNGILRFVGFDVLPPFIAWNVRRCTQKQREQYLRDYAQRLLTLEGTKPLFFHRAEDYDENGLLKPEVAVKTPGQRTVCVANWYSRGDRKRIQSATMAPPREMV